MAGFTSINLLALFIKLPAIAYLRSISRNCWVFDTMICEAMSKPKAELYSAGVFNRFMDQLEEILASVADLREELDCIPIIFSTTPEQTCSICCIIPISPI